MNRREFLKDLSAGVVAAGIGTQLASDLGLSTALDRKSVV